MWIVPTEFTAALNGIAGAFGGGSVTPPSTDGAGETGESATERARRNPTFGDDDAFAETSLQDPSEALRQARSEASEATHEAQDATVHGRRRSAAPTDAPVTPPPPAPGESPYPPHGGTPGQ